METIQENEQKITLSRNEKKWPDFLMKAGWTTIPSVILERQKDLKLDPISMNIILQLTRYWWYADNPPHPSKRRIAECMGVDISTVRRRIALLEKEGLIRREFRKNEQGHPVTNAYHLDGLIKAAEPHAAQAIAMKKKRSKKAILSQQITHSS